MCKIKVDTILGLWNQPTSIKYFFNVKNHFFIVLFVLCICLNISEQNEGKDSLISQMYVFIISNCDSCELLSVLPPIQIFSLDWTEGSTAYQFLSCGSHLFSSCPENAMFGDGADWTVREHSMTHYWKKERQGSSQMWRNRQTKGIKGMK